MNPAPIPIADLWARVDPGTETIFFVGQFGPAVLVLAPTPGRMSDPNASTHRLILAPPMPGLEPRPTGSVLEVRQTNGRQGKRRVAA